MDHDFDKKHGGDGNPGTGPCAGLGFMSYVHTKLSQWSICSKKDFEAHYNVILEKEGAEWCLTEDASACETNSTPNEETNAPEGTPNEETNAPEGNTVKPQHSILAHLNNCKNDSPNPKVYCCYFLSN